MAGTCQTFCSVSIAFSQPTYPEQLVKTKYKSSCFNFCEPLLKVKGCQRGWGNPTKHNFCQVKLDLRLRPGGSAKQQGSRRAGCLLEASTSYKKYTKWIIKNR